MPPETSHFSDNKRDLWFRIASNFYDYGTTLGVAGLEAPSWNDSPYGLIKKTVNNSASISELFE